MCPLPVHLASITFSSHAEVLHGEQRFMFIGDPLTAQMPCPGPDPIITCKVFEDSFDRVAT
jgi:hypothetical protein